MRNVKRSIAFWGVIGTLWLVSAVRSGDAQDLSSDSYATERQYAYQAPASEGDWLDEFDASGSSGALETSDLEPTWTERIAGLTRGRMQIEVGYSYLHDTVGGAEYNQHALPDFLLRYGLTDRLEIRLGWPGYVESSSSDPLLINAVDGALNPNVGFLFDLWRQRGVLPQTAILAAVPVDLGGNPFALNSLQPLTELMYAWETSERSSITGRSGIALFETNGDHYVQFQQSVSYDMILTDRIGGFLSWDMLIDHGSWNDASQHMLGGGLSILTTDRTSVGLHSAVGLNAEAPNFLSDIRLTYRF